MSITGEIEFIKKKKLGVGKLPFVIQINVQLEDVDFSIHFLKFSNAVPFPLPMPTKHNTKGVYCLHINYRYLVTGFCFFFYN